jgi:hypothetical protein
MSHAPTGHLPAKANILYTYRIHTETIETYNGIFILLSYVLLPAELSIHLTSINSYLDLYLPLLVNLEPICGLSRLATVFHSTAGLFNAE